MNNIGNTTLSVTKRKTKLIRVLHASDIHLDSCDLVSTCGLEDRAYRALKALVDLSIRARASLVMIAGDLFDHNRVDSMTVEIALQELRRALVPVVILPGNHDCLVSDSVYQRACFSEPASIVRVFTASEGETFLFPELDLSVWGKPINSYGGHLRPLAGIPPRGRERWQIAVAHGHYVGSQFNATRSFQIDHQEIVQSCRDYVALGHSGGFRCICNETVKAYYSGSASESGTVAIVDLVDEVGVQVRSCSLPL